MYFFLNHCLIFLNHRKSKRRIKGGGRGGAESGKNVVRIDEVQNEVMEEILRGRGRERERGERKKERRSRERERERHR